MGFIAVLIAKFLDPISFILAGLIGAACHKQPRYSTIIIGFSVALLVEIILASTQIGRTFGMTLHIGIMASSCHAYIGWWIKNRRKSRSNKA
jgi:ABC-type uncharacterized transport system permease subunit